MGECAKGRNWTGAQWEQHPPVENTRVLANGKENAANRRAQGLRVAPGSLLSPRPCLLQGLETQERPNSQFSQS